jgi:hypothetical protein
MIGTLGLITSLAGTVASGVGSYMANKKRQEAIDAQEAEANQYYLKEMFQDPTKRADNAAYLAQLDRRLKKQNEVAKATQKITGGTQEQAVATQEATANAYADAISKLGAISSQRRDTLNNQWRREQRGYDAIRNEMQAQQMQNWGNLANNAAQLGSAALQSGGILSGKNPLKKSGYTNVGQKAPEGMVKGKVNGEWASSYDPNLDFSNK